MISVGRRAVIVVVLAVLGVSGCGAADEQPSIAAEAWQKIDGRLETYRAIANLGTPADKQPGMGEACFNSTFQTTCVDRKGRRTFAHSHRSSDEQRYFWLSKTAEYGNAVYQPKDDGRVFFMHRTNDGLMFWVVYDPKGRDLPGWLKTQGFSEVGSYNAKFAYAGRIQDVQKRRDFWIWLQGREYQMKEFEKKYPHLAAHELSKEPR